MYRDASLSLEETIARLEAEVRELRALGGKRRERRLLVTAVISMMVAIHAVIGCVAAKVQAERLEHDAAQRLQSRTSDLIACVRRLDARDGDLDACRARTRDCSCPDAER